MDDLEKAKEQLTAALKWRKEYQPLKAKDDVFDADKFASIGYVTKVKAAKETPNEEDIACFNIYGNAAKESKKIFGDTDAYVVAARRVSLHTPDLTAVSSAGESRCKSSPFLSSTSTPPTSPFQTTARAQIPTR